MAVLGTLKTFQGGHYFGQFEGSPKAKRIQTKPAPKRVLIPLRQGFGEEATALVKEGDRVKTGQMIGRADAKISTPVHASLTGKIIKIEKRAHPLGGGPATVVIIESDGPDEWQKVERPHENFERMTPDQVGKILYEAGVTSVGRAGFPTAYKSAPVTPDKIRNLMINAVETEPYFEGDNQLLYEEFDKFVNGIKVLRQALGNVQVHCGLAYNKARVYEELVVRMEFYDWFYLHALRDKYPQGDDDVLVRTLLDQLIPSGGSATDVGCVVVDVQHVIAAYEAVIEGRPFVERIVSVAGSGMKEIGNFRVRLGTSIRDLITSESPSRIILGSVMRGTAQTDLDAPILKNTAAVIALKEAKRAFLPMVGPGFDKDSYTNSFVKLPLVKKKATTSLNGNERPCVNCGYCVDVCPQNLVPVRLGEYSVSQRLEAAEKLDIFACIECGLCAYVCPSKIPLLEQIRQGKKALK
jgi:RnfABCDGE-type electron transport complex C subunit